MLRSVANFGFSVAGVSQFDLDAMQRCKVLQSVIGLGAFSV